MKTSCQFRNHVVIFPWISLLDLLLCLFRLYLHCSPCLCINLLNEPCCGVWRTYTWCSFLIKTIPLGGNWCYLRLGWSRMGGGKQEVWMRWYRSRADRKPLCNLVRLEMEAVINPTGLNCCSCTQRKCTDIYHRRLVHLGVHRMCFVQILCF